jgi:hypothetical protein
MTCPICSVWNWSKWYVLEVCVIYLLWVLFMATSFVVWTSISAMASAELYDMIRLTYNQHMWTIFWLAVAGLVAFCVVLLIGDHE